MAKFVKIDSEKFEIEKLKKRFINSPYFTHYDFRRKFKRAASFFSKYDNKRRSYEMKILNRRLDPNEVPKIEQEMKILKSNGLVGYWIVLFPIALIFSWLGILLFVLDMNARKRIHSDFLRAISIYHMNPDLPPVYASEEKYETYPKY